MSLKHYKAITPSLRSLISINRSEVWAGGPLKCLTRKKTSKSGRNNLGHITVRHKSGGHKRSYRVIDFKRNKFDSEVVVKRIEYDPNRTSFIALIEYSDGTNSYILAPNKLSVGDTVLSSSGQIEVKIGNSMPVSFIPTGTLIHNVELRPFSGGALSRSAGAYSQIIGKDGVCVAIKMQSGLVRYVSPFCMATVGSLSNQDNKNISRGKAGRSRWLGIRPTVRGVAMNPVDHPHGGGEGKTSGGRHPVSYSGKLAKGAKTTRKKSAHNNYF